MRRQRSTRLHSSGFLFLGLCRSRKITVTAEKTHGTRTDGMRSNNVPSIAIPPFKCPAHSRISAPRLTQKEPTTRSFWMQTKISRKTKPFSRVWLKSMKTAILLDIRLDYPYHITVLSIQTLNHSPEVFIWSIPSNAAVSPPRGYLFRPGEPKHFKKRVIIKIQKDYCQGWPGGIPIRTL
jgi:hypothetical protein